ncbi:hypothetical protein EJB05_10505 [Eragrostis curvula]|uniref:Myb-like domain-containing protein n=1 Tax=Eragrostis curvula TaxID=38414 RepID=A0A5J9VLA0_9POAL|nr:hypothetical protein EJB05_10505 [Eragrostis curvula]
MPVVEPNPIEEKKPKEESTAMKKKKKRKREPEEGKGKSKSNSQEYLEMEKGGAVNIDEDLEIARRLAKKRKTGKGKLGGEDGFDGDLGSGEETKAHDLNVADGTEFDQKKKKKKKKKAKKDVMDEENGGSVRESEDKTKLDKKRRKKKKDKAEKDSVELEELDNADAAEGDDGVVFESEKCSVTLEEGKQLDMSKGEHKKSEGKRKRKESGSVGQDVGQNTQAAGDVKSDNKEREKSKDKNEGGEMEKEKAAQRKDKGKRVSFIDAVEVFGDGDFGSDKETKARDLNVADGTEFDQKKEKKKKKKAKKDVMGEENGGSVRESEDKTKLDKKRKKKKKKRDESELVHGKRFTPEENAKLMEAMINYAEMKQLGEQGLEMLRTSVKHPELRGCWAEIANALPHRPPVAVYKRARILLNRSTERKWTEEEYETIRRPQSERMVKQYVLLCKGTWTQDEYQNLFDLVNLDLRVKAHQQLDHGHRLIRDNISWEAISDKLTTRSNKDCCLKWYQQLASPLVKEGVWSDTDDYLLVEALQKVDAVCPEDVDWDNLLDHRSGELCRQRWNQMVRLLGGHREKSFIEQVEVLSRRYCPEMLDYRK